MAGSGEPAIGIDLRTTYSCVAIFRNEKAEIIENPLGYSVTPSMVAFTQHDRLVGIAAKYQAASNPTNTISEVKRLVGRNFQDKTVQDDIKHWPFAVVEGKDGKPMIKVKHKGIEQQFTAEQISEMVLSYLKEAAEKRLGCGVKNAVVTVPAYFNDAQRCATRDAATIAGLNILRIINEPTAAALAYGLDKAVNGRLGKKKVLIFDLGGGTFDVTVLEIDNGVLEVKATLGDTHLGGADIDNRLLKHFTQELENRYGQESTQSARVLRRLQQKCEETKRMLTSTPHATLTVDGLCEGAVFMADISRAKFENLNFDLFEKCIAMVEKCLKDANLDKREIDDVVLVGGSSRIPKIQELIKEFFDYRDILCNSINPDEAVACGAAIQAAMLIHAEKVVTRNVADSGVAITNNNFNSTLMRNFLTLKDVTPRSLGVQTMTGEMMFLIQRNTPIPCKKQDVVVNGYHKQTVAAFRVYEGENTIATDNCLLGEFCISGFKPRSQGKVKFDVLFDIDANGILTVSAIERKSKISAAVTISDDRGRLTPEEKEMMIHQVRAYKAEQEQRAQVALAKEELDNFAYYLRNMIQSHAIESQLQPSQRTRMLAAIGEAMEWSEKNKYTATRSDYDREKSTLLSPLGPLSDALSLLSLRR